MPEDRVPEGSSIRRCVGASGSSPPTSRSPLCIARSTTSSGHVGPLRHHPANLDRDVAEGVEEDLLALLDRRSPPHGLGRERVV